jgi:hypothetical protein
MRARIRARESVDTAEAGQLRRQRDLEAQDEQWDELVTLAAAVSKKFYSSGVVSLSLDVLSKELANSAGLKIQTTPGATNYAAAAVKVEELIRNLANVEVPGAKKWLTVVESAFRKGSYVVKVNKDVAMGEVVAVLKKKKTEWNAEIEDNFQTPRSTGEAATPERKR